MGWLVVLGGLLAVEECEGSMLVAVGKQIEISFLVRLGLVARHIQNRVTAIIWRLHLQV